MPIDVIINSVNANTLNLKIEQIATTYIEFIKIINSSDFITMLTAYGNKYSRIRFNEPNQTTEEFALTNEMFERQLEVYTNFEDSTQTWLIGKTPDYNPNIKQQLISNIIEGINGNITAFKSLLRKQKIRETIIPTVYMDQIDEAKLKTLDGSNEMYEIVIFFQFPGNIDKTALIIKLENSTHPLNSLIKDPIEDLVECLAILATMNKTFFEELKNSINYYNLACDFTSFSSTIYTPEELEMISKFGDNLEKYLYGDDINFNESHDKLLNLLISKLQPI